MLSIEMDPLMQLRSSKGLQKTLTFKISLKRIFTFFFCDRVHLNVSETLEGLLQIHWARVPFSNPTACEFERSCAALSISVSVVGGAPILDRLPCSNHHLSTTISKKARPLVYRYLAGPYASYRANVYFYGLPVWLKRRKNW